jgi:glycine dehydrogenase
VVHTRALPLGIDVVVGDHTRFAFHKGVFGVLLQYPATDGVIHDYEPFIRAAHEHHALAVVATDLLALTLLKPPGEFGADVAVGSAQRFGVPMGYGGPHAAFFATRDAYKRHMPGRLVGVSRDAQGRPALRLALQTREQHIRREKATSNICTAQVLLAVMASMYAVYHGPEGLKRIARRVHTLAASFAATLGEPQDGAFFDTLHFRRVPKLQGVNVPEYPDGSWSMSLDETTTAEDLTRLAGRYVGSSFEPQLGAFARTTPFLTHPVFNQYHTEHEMLRYIKRLEAKDLSLTTSMIPLGSCTMKLNAAVEMEPITWPEFARLHPFAPASDSPGLRRVIADLESWLVQITGYDAVSLQPNAGSQGEYAGLLAIHDYHASRGEPHRDICLIPSSAHGTNAASAALAGLRVAVVACRDNGDVDLDDLRAKVAEHADRLATLMITYPSTHGVYEHDIAEICAAVHDAGGQVYVDGANLNALVGLARPGRFGGDISHLNLHKTFCIPHGGGGPGVGPVAARSHLAAFLPGHPYAPELPGGRPVSSAPYGSASILPITWAYIRMMGADGLRAASLTAIASANYIARRLDEYFPVLYTGENGMVAHECILDLRGITKSTGVTVDDVAKRLADYGFHAPTMSFPVAGTLMVEPTESESLTEVDAFCEAMIAIRGEIDKVAARLWPVEDNPLRGAPHTAECLVVSDWDHPYTRKEAAYPLGKAFRPKVWPPVRRIDGAYGDRNLVCSCPPVEAFV